MPTLVGVLAGIFRAVELFYVSLFTLIAAYDAHGSNSCLFHLAIHLGEHPVSVDMDFPSFFNQLPNIYPLRGSIILYLTSSLVMDIYFVTDYPLLQAVCWNILVQTLFYVHV